MENASRKAAVAEYKKRKSVAGIYAVRCAATGEVWVGRAGDIEKIQTRLWFGLRTGGSQHPAMQKAWNAHGADSFSFEELELIEGDGPGFAHEAALKDRLAHWKSQLNAGVV